MPTQRIEALARLIEILESARHRKPMYFQPVEPRAFTDWLNGLHIGCSIAGLEWSTEARRRVLEKRGLEFRACCEVDQLAGRGLGPEEIVDELLAIEIEMWKSMTPDEIEPSDDSLTDDLLASDGPFQALVEKSRSSPRRPLPDHPRG
jgi:hypothetical protein